MHHDGGGERGGDHELTALGDWLKQIILIVLLATIADLLLPTKTMQKYVRMVMGLAIVAAMLQPMVPFFKGDFADQMAKAAWLESGGQISLPTPSTTSLSNILQRQQQTNENLYADKTLKEAVLSKFNVTVTNIKLSGTGAPSDPLHVTLTLNGQNPTQVQEIRTFVAGYLQLPTTAVTIAGANGGMSNGF